MNDKEYLVESEHLIEGRLAEEWILFGFIHNLLRSYDYAIECYDKALSLKPHDQTALKDRQEIIQKRQEQIRESWCYLSEIKELLDTWAEVEEELSEREENKPIKSQSRFEYNQNQIEKLIRNPIFFNKIQKGIHIDEIPITEIENELSMHKSESKQLNEDMDLLYTHQKSIIEKGFNATNSERRDLAKMILSLEIEIKQKRSEYNKLNYISNICFNFKCLLEHKDNDWCNGLISRIDAIPPQKMIFWLARLHFHELIQDVDSEGYRF